MKKRITIISIAALLTVALGINFTASALDATTPTEEQYFSAQENVSTVKDEEISHSLFTAGNNVDNNAKVKGILFSAGNTVNINNLSEYGFIAGNSININSEVEKDLFVAGNSISINQSTIINRDLYIVGNNITIDANIKGNVFAAGNTIKIGNTAKIEGDLQTNAENIEFGSQAKVAGTFNYNSNAIIKNLNADNFGLVTTYQETNSEAKTQNSAITSIVSIIVKIFAGITTFIVISYVFPRTKKYFNEAAQVHNGIIKHFGIGFATLILTPFACLILLCTVIGAPLSIMLAILYGISLYLSINIAGIHLGKVLFEKVFNQKPNTIASIITGIILVNLILLIPIFGGIFAFFAMCYGLGVIMYMFFHGRKEESSEKPAKKPAKKDTKPILLAKK